MKTQVRSVIGGGTIWSVVVATANNGRCPHCRSERPPRPLFCLNPRRVSLERRYDRTCCATPRCGRADGPGRACASGLLSDRQRSDGYISIHKLIGKQIMRLWPDRSHRDLYEDSETEWCDDHPRRSRRGPLPAQTPNAPTVSLSQGWSTPRDYLHLRRRRVTAIPRCSSRKTSGPPKRQGIFENGSTPLAGLGGSVA